MQRFYYKELQTNGNYIKGEMDAHSREEVENTIKARGGIVVDVEPLKGKIKLSKYLSMDLGGGKVKLPELAVFSKQMSTMLSTGMTLVHSLEVISEQTNNKTLKSISREMSLEIQKGNTLSGIMRSYPKVFPKFMLSMIYSGELTGQIDRVFENLNTHYTKEAKINKKIVGAMIYPIILILVAILLLLVVFAVVIPTFVTLYEGQDLPALTQGLINASEILRNYWYLVSVFVFSIVFLINRFVKTKKGKLLFDKGVVYVPVVGKMLNIIATSRFTRTLGTLLGSGITIIPALTSSAELTNNEVLINHMEHVVDEIKKGRSLGVLLKEINFFPPMMVSMIAIGEESGDIDGMLNKTSDYYDEELESAITTMLNLIEPMMLIVMGVLIGVMIIAIMLPLFNMYSNFSNF